MFAAHTRAILIALLFSVTAVACRDEVLGPPDAASCTVGTIRAGERVTGRVDGRSCDMWNDYHADVSPAESWQLQVEPGKAYIVRLEPRAIGADSSNTFRGALYAWARNRDGDGGFAAGYQNSYGPVNGNNGQARQMVFVPGRAQRISLRVQTFEPTDTGAYALEVITCPVRHVEIGATSPAVTLADSCAYRAGAALDSIRVTFFSFDAAEDTELQVTATRTAGDANLRMRVGGPDLDFSCYTDDCTQIGTGSTAGPATLTPTFRETGRFAAMLSQETAGSLTVTVGVASTAMLRSSTPSPR